MVLGLSRALTDYVGVQARLLTGTWHRFKETYSLLVPELSAHMQLCGMSFLRLPAVYTQDLAHCEALYKEQNSVNKQEY